MKKNTILIFIASIGIVIIVMILITVINNKDIKTNNQHSETSAENDIISAEQQNEVGNTVNNRIAKEYQYDITSTENNRIEKDGIEAENIHIYTVGSQTEVTAKIKNNTDKVLNGFFIEIKLLDENNNEITSIAENSNDSINPNESTEFVCYVNGIEQSENIKNAIISVLEAHN